MSYFSGLTGLPSQLKIGLYPSEVNAEAVDDSGARLSCGETPGRLKRNPPVLIGSVLVFRSMNHVKTHRF
jgi:hypothetical protein